MRWMKIKSLQKQDIENIIELLRKVYAKNVSLKIKKTSEEVAIESLQEVETIIGLLRFYNEKEIR